jgi:N-acetylglutamate synthase-like GNAT family acetyltransferase
MSDQQVRQAKIKDAPKITKLLAQLDYPIEEELVIIKLSAMLMTNDNEIFVYVDESVVTGFLSMHLCLNWVCRAI